MLVGMIPMALGLGDGGEQTCTARTCGHCGLLLATVATLIFVPAVFQPSARTARAAGAASLRQAYRLMASTHRGSIPCLPDDTRNSKSDSTNLSPSARRKRRSWRPAALTATVVAVGGAIFARFVDRVDAEEKPRPHDLGSRRSECRG